MSINFRTFSMAVVLVGMTASPVLVIAQPESSSALLLSGAKKWVEKGRTDRAKSLLHKLITIEPGSQEGLFMLGDIELKNGNREEALRYLQLLETSAPNSRRTNELRAAIHQTGNVQAAPKMEAEPVNKSAKKPVITSDKNQVMTSEKPVRASKPNKVAVSVPDVIDPDIIARTDALDALGDGNVELAESSLLDILKRRPQDAEVIGGLGFVKLKQGKPVEAEQWFEQALQAATVAKGETLRWESLIETARFWIILRAAEALLEDRKLADAEAIIQQALLLKPDNPAALAVLGNIKVANNEPVEAERVYRAALDKEGYNVPSLVGLVGLLSKTQRNAEALVLLEGVLNGYPLEWRKNPASQARLLREVGNLYIAENQPSHAIKALEQAVQADPLNPWSRFFLAKSYISVDLTPLGKRVMQEGAELAPADTQMHYVRALVLLSLDDYSAGLASLSRIPDAELTEPMRETRDRAQIQHYIQQAENKLERGDRKEAMRIMSIAEAQMGTSIPATEQVAEGWFKLGLPKQGLSAMKKLPKEIPLKTQVHYAFLLNRAKADPELVEFLPSVQIPDRNDEVNEKYRKSIRDIEFDMAGRHFEQLLKAGKKEQAQNFAETVLSANDLSSSEYFRMRRNHFSDADLPDNSIALLNQEKEHSPDDLDIRMDLAYVYHKEKQDSNARRELQEALAMTPEDDIDRRLRITRLQGSVGDLSGARKTIGDLTRRYPHNTQVLFQAGHIARASGQYDDAMGYFEQTKAQSQAETPSSSATLAEQKAESDILLSLLPAKTEASMPGRGQWVATSANTASSTRIYRAALASDAAQKDLRSDSLVVQADQMIDSIASRRRASIEGGLDIQSRQSSNGMSTYNATEVPLVARIPLGYEAHGTVQFDRVNLDASPLPATVADSSLFGKLQAYQYVPAQPIASNVSGTSVALGYERDSVKTDIGVVGIGFPVKNLVGGVRKQGVAGNLSYSLNLSRRPVTGSVLSYAGATDPASGAVWGGVTNTGLSLYMSSALSKVNVSTSASLGVLRGKNVLNNDRVYFRAMLDKDIYNEDDTIFNAGLSATFERYSKNESFYTFGHGGYYSPQSSLTFGVPMMLKARDDAFAFQIRGDLNYSTTRTDSALYHPNDPVLQAMAVARQLNNGAVYQGVKGGGFGYSMSAMAEYRLESNLVLGGRFNIERSAYYAPNSILFYLKYLFTPETEPVGMNPSPVIPYSQF